MEERMSRTSHTKYQGGFTVLEIFIALVIFTMVVGLVGAFARNVFFYKTISNDSLVTIQDARSVIRTMVAELRSASPSSNGAYPIIQAGTTSLAFFSDVEGDTAKEQIRYFASGTQLYRGVIILTGSPLTYATSTEKITILDSNLRNGTSTNIFDYYDGFYNGVASTSALTQPVMVNAVRLIKVTLILDVNQNSLPVSRTYTTQVTLRNIKDNL